MAWLSRSQLEQLGFAALGDDVLISDRCSIYGAEHIRFGHHVRIDDFAIVTAKAPVSIGSYNHISAHVFLGGTHGVEMADFVNLSVGVAVFTSCDDFSGGHLPGAMVPERYRGLKCGPVRFGEFTGAGANSVILPGVEFPIGSVVGALTLVNRSLEPWTLYSGVPARRVRRTTQRIAELAEELRAEERALAS